MKQITWAINNSFPAAVAWLFVGYIDHIWPLLSESLAPWHYCLAGYFTVACILDGIVEPWYEARLKSQQNLLCLSTQGDGDLPSRFSHFIDCHIMNRYSFFGYKNNVQSNLRILSAFMMTLFSVFSVLTTAHLLETLNLWPGYVGDHLPPSFYGGTVLYLAGSFALEKWSYFEKWKYMSERYQAMIEREPGARRDIFESAFVCDLVSTNMWSHESYQDVFEKNMVKAMSMHWGEYPFKTTDLKFTRQSLMTRPLPKQMALRALQDRQERLMTSEHLNAIASKKAS